MSNNPEKNEHWVEIFKGVGITKSYRSRAGTFELGPIDINLDAGEITAVVGENGAGKTTLLRIAARQLAATGGSLMYPYSQELERTSMYEIRQRVVMLRQELPSWNGTLKNNLHFTASIHGITGTENEDWVDFILDRLSLEKYKDATWKEISGGFRTRYSLARALIQRPNLIALDEPLANLDINTQLKFLTDLRELSAEFVEPLGILISSQHLHEIESICDKIIFLRDGTAEYNGLKEDFEQNRNENTFELVTNVDRKSLEKLLKPLGLINIQQAGDNHLIRIPVRVGSDEMLRALLDGGVNIELFRDISRSTRKLFSVEE